MKKFIHALLVCILVTGCSIFTSGEKVTIKKEKKKKNTLFTYDSVSRDVSGIIQEGPGRYPRDDDQVHTTIPKKAIEDLKTLPPNMDAETAYNQLIYLFRRDYQMLEFRFANIKPVITVSEERKKAKPRKEHLRVNIVVLMDSGPEMLKTIPGTKRKKFDRLKQQVKNSILDLRRNIPQGITYYVMFSSYDGIANIWSDLAPLDQVEEKVFPRIDEVVPGGEPDLPSQFELVMELLENQTAGNVLNQVFMITGSERELEFSSFKRAHDLFESEVQAQVHAINYGVTNQEVIDDLQSIADAGLGDYIVANPKNDVPFDFKDQTDFSDDGYNPREYQKFRIEDWTKRIAELKQEQILAIDTLYEEEYQQLMAATKYLKMKEEEKEKLFEEIEFRRKLLSRHYQRELDRLKSFYQYSRDELGLK